MTMAQRRNDIDAVKGISMLCIVVGHSGISFISRFVFTFHVPIFLIISGLFFTPREGLIKKRSVQMIKPYLSTAVIIYAVLMCKTLVSLLRSHTDGYAFAVVTRNSVLEILYGSGSRHDFLNFDLPAIGATWFLLAIIWATAILYAVEKYLPKKLKGAVIVFMFLAAYFSAKLTWLPLSVQAGAASALFLYMGYLAKQHKLFEKPVKPVLFACAVLFWGTALYFSYAHKNMSIVKCAFPDPLINIAGAAGASYIIIVIVGKIDKIKLLASSAPYHFLCYWGRCSGTILCCHLIELRTVNWHIIGDMGKPFIIVVFVLKLAFITLGTWFIQKHEKIRSFF